MVMDSKFFGKSWTVWFNALVAAIWFFFREAGSPLDPALMDSILVLGVTVGNLIIRIFKTQGPVHVAKPK